MQLHSINPTKRRKAGKRVGRGGKRGTYSGLGEKGQRKRAGHRIRPAARDILLKFPKLRGVKNKSRAERTTVVNVRDLPALAKIAESGVITKDVLMKKGLIHSLTEPVKVLGDGALTVSVTVSGIPVSAQAREKIEKAGGKVL